MTAKRPPWEVACSRARFQLRAWGDTDGEDRLATIEADVSHLIRELATARSELVVHNTEQRTALERHLLSLLDVADGFERVLANINSRQSELTPAMKAWTGNFRTVYRLLERALEEQGVSPIETPTREFDPTWHVAAESVVDPCLPVGTIVEDIKRGYVWQHRPLRKTEVVVVSSGDRGG
jgi:molecular chaperone GrpE (heat shock protein)